MEEGAEQQTTEWEMLLLDIGSGGFNLDKESEVCNINEGKGNEGTTIESSLGTLGEEERGLIKGSRGEGEEGKRSSVGNRKKGEGKEMEAKKGEWAVEVEGETQNKRGERSGENPGKDVEQEKEIGQSSGKGKELSIYVQGGSDQSVPNWKMKDIREEKEQGRELVKEVALQVKVALANIKAQVQEEDFIKQVEVYTETQIEEVKKAYEARECSKTRAKAMTRALVRAETTAITTYQTVVKLHEESRKRKCMEDEKEGEIEFRQLVEESEKQVAKKLKSRKRARSIRGLGYEGVQAGRKGKKTQQGVEEASPVVGGK